MKWVTRRRFLAYAASVLFLLLAGCGPEGIAPEKERLLPEVLASQPRGVCDKPFSLSLTTAAAAARIRYTLDGTLPTAKSGRAYDGPISIAGTTTLRAAGFVEVSQVSKTATYTYIFLDDVLRQPRDPPGFPAGPAAWNGTPSAYHLDPGMVGDPSARERLKDGLRALPLLSIVCRKEDLFDAKTGLYLNTLQSDDSWERSCSAEFVEEAGKGFQINCGIRIQGGQSRVPMKSPKHSFRLVFKTEYGPGKLRYPIFPDSPVTEFNTLVLRADFNNSWIHWDASARPRGQRIRDAWMKDSHHAMGWVAPHNRYFHLYLNGLYWGVYDATERPDANFAAAYFGGERSEYDVINESQAKDGTMEAFSVLNSPRDYRSHAVYERLHQLLDVTEYMDYLLVHYYAGNQDVGENKNWYAIRRHTPAEPFRFIMWDGEQIFHDVIDDTVSDPFETPFRLANQLRENAEFRLAFADRVQKHFFNGGALTPESASARWMRRAAQVDRAITAESARWGYYRRNPPFTREDDWLKEQRRLLTTYFPRRTGIVLEQLRAAKLYPLVRAPAFHQRRGAAGSLAVTLQSIDDRVYFTSNGGDPRVSGSNKVSPEAQIFPESLAVQPPLVIKARAWKDGAWSALTVAEFTPPTTP